MQIHLTMRTSQWPASTKPLLALEHVFTRALSIEVEPLLQLQCSSSSGPPYITTQYVMLIST